jgi:signal transduction histidine kinase/CheY-like chemotaxis protein
MTKLGGYLELSETRSSTFFVRLIVSAFISIASFTLVQDTWPFFYLLAVIINQTILFFIDYLILESKLILTRKLKVTLFVFITISSPVYISIAGHLWFCGQAAQAFAIMIVCGSLLHSAVHLQTIRPLLIAVTLSQAPFMFGLPIYGAFVQGRAGLGPCVVMICSWLLYLAHLQLIVVKGHQSKQALQAANILAEERRMSAEEANRSKSTFLMTVSHEIRTPLNAVTSAAHLLHKMDLPEAGRECVSILLSGSDVLLSLINDVLDISKIEAGKLDLDMGEVELRPLVEKLVALWTPRAAERGLRLELSIAADTPAVVRADALRLTQILFNLISNAVKFTEEGSVRISMGRADPSGTSTLYFEVRDTGPGMTPNVLQRLFRNFEQADAGITKKFGGTGLGLAISRKLVELMGGELTVDSVVGQGSVFRAELPLPEVCTPAPAPVPQAEDGEEMEPAADIALSILLAEDHPVNRRIVELFLKPLGCELTMAVNGAEAVELAELRGFDVILMDMQMPVLSGLDAALRIKAGTGPNRETPIIALTANAFEDQRQAWARAGAAAFLTKPIDPEALIEAILQHAQRGGDQPLGDAVQAA